MKTIATCACLLLLACTADPVADPDTSVRRVRDLAPLPDAVDAASARLDLGSQPLAERDGGVDALVAPLELDAGACGVQEVPDPTLPGGCACILGAARCFEDAVQTCVQRTANEVNWSDPVACPISTYCDMGTCVDGHDDCRLGALRCSADLVGVEICRTSEAEHGFTRWFSLLDCTDHGAESCAGGQDGGPAEESDAAAELRGQLLCINACSTPNVPLDARPGDRHPQIPCAVWICDAGHLVPDHTACLGHGQSCTHGSDCKSCRCTDGLCDGNAVETCALE